MVTPRRSIMVVAAVPAPRITGVAGNLRVGVKRTADRDGQAVTAQKECSKDSAMGVIHRATVGQRNNIQRPIS